MDGAAAAGDEAEGLPAEGGEGPPPEPPAAAAGDGPQRGRKALRRAAKAQRREEHQRCSTREQRALLEVLRALRGVVPALAELAPPGRAAGGVEAAREQPAAAPAPAAGGAPAGEAAAREALAAQWADGTRGVPGVGLLGRRSPPRGPPDEEAAASALEAMEAALRTESPYRSLPEAFGPTECLPVLEGMLERPQKYQEKMLGQELSLLAKVFALARCEDDAAETSRLAVIDIGAGNGCLALLAAVLLGGYAVLIDHTLPPDELRVELRIPEPYRSRVLRITGDIAHVDLSRDVDPLMDQHGIRGAVLVAKHLCGTGTDLAGDFARRWREGGKPTAEAAPGGRRPQLLGVAFATCCGHKIRGPDRLVYADLYRDDPYLRRLTGGSAEPLPELLGICTRCIAWRTTAGDAASRITALQVRAAELFEDALQQPRLNLLRGLFPEATEVAFVSAGRSPQNRCLLAGSARALREALGPGEAFASRLRAARGELLEAAGGPLDLKPRGFVSSKYDYDGA